MSFDPVTLTLLSIGVSLAGTAVSTISSINSDNYQAQIAERNSQIQEENANRAIARSQQEQQDQDRKSAYLLGTQVADQGASGLSLGGGSFILSRKSARTLARMDALNVRQAGELEAYNYRVMSQDSADAAEFAHQQAGFDLLGGFLGAGKSIIGGAGKLYDQGAFSPAPYTYSKASDPMQGVW